MVIGVDHISISRRLPIAGGVLPRVLLRLREDTAGGTLRWNLGERGTCEVDVSFARVVNGSASARFTSSALLAEPEGGALTPVDVTLAACDGDESELAFRPSEQISDWWTDHLAAYLDLAHAALEELAQELLWHHSRLVNESAA